MINLLDFKFVQEIKNGGKIKISIKGLKKSVDCSPEKRKECYKYKRGACCINHKNGHCTQYDLDELKLLPEKIKNCVDSNGVVKQDGTGICILLNECIKNPLIKPTVCSLYPIRFNKSGRLILHRMAWLRPCPMYGKGNPVYISIKDNLIQVFGEEIYKKIVYMVENGIEEL